MPKASSNKLGRNPFEKATLRRNPEGPSLPFIGESTSTNDKPVSLGLMAVKDKIKELEIKVDWKEFYKTVVEMKLKRIYRIASK